MAINCPVKYPDFPLMGCRPLLEGIQNNAYSCTYLKRMEDQKSAVLSCEFHPSGEYFLSANRAGQIRIDSMSSLILAWEAHMGAVMEAHFSSDGGTVYSCSEDETLGIWDTISGERIGSLNGHTGTVNSVYGARNGEPVLCSGGNDGAVRVWDAREGACVMSLETSRKVTSTTFGYSGEYVFSGGYDKNVSIWDLRTRNVICSLEGHTGVVTGLALSPCGSYILSNSQDNTHRIWDIRPYTSFNREVTCFYSTQQYPSGLLKCDWSPDGGMISYGTSGCIVPVLDVINGDKLLDLSPHDNSVNDVAFHPGELIMLSASNDNCLFLHELTK